MCGLFGHLSHNLDEAARANARRAAAQLAHRGPDGAGAWSDRHCVLTHRRLSIIDLSPAGAQPMLSGSGQSVISFNGEIYNHVELRDRMAPPSGGWRGTSDTEVLLERLEREGPAGLRDAIGMFAFAFWRPDERELWLVRDRLGEKPLFYTRLPTGDLLFSSELGPLLESPGVNRQTSFARIAEFLQNGYLSAPRTPFLAIDALPPGSILRARLRDGRIDVRIDAYWSLGQRPVAKRTEQEWLEEFTATLQDAVRITLRSDVPLSALLSGGVDSSVVCLLAARAAGGQLNTLTADAGGGTSELTFAREVADHIGARHTAVPLVPVTERDIDGLARLYPELMGDPSALAALAVCRTVRSQSTVVLTGDGGDEIGGGYTRYRLSLSQQRGAARLPDVARRVARAIATKYPVWARGEQRLAALAPYRHPYAAAVQMYPTHAIPPVLRRARPPAEPVHEALLEFSDSPPLVQMMLADAQTYIPGDTLVTLDRASMSVSLELRAPLLDYRLFELVRDAQDHYIAAGDTTKRAFREVFAPQLPTRVFNRSKAGFSVPLDEWLQKLPLEELLLSGRTREVLRASSVRALLLGYRAGVNHHAGRLWHLLVLGRWLDTWRPTISG